MAENARDAEAEADRHVRSDGAKRIRTDEAKECTDAKRAEDQSDETTEQTDEEAADDSRRRALGAGAPSGGRTARAQQVDPEDDERDADRDQ